MADLLRADSDGLSVLAGEAAAWYLREQGLRLPASSIEKDYWVTEVLRSLSEPLNIAPTPQEKAGRTVVARAVFKGGTSLSKAHRLLHRFSEDVDVYLDAYDVNSSNHALAVGQALGKSRMDRVMKAASARVTADLGLGEPEEFRIQTSGVKRGYVYAYSSAESAPGLKNGVQLELVRMGHPAPSSRHLVTSLLADYLAATGKVALGEFDDLAGVTIDVLAAERTLVDKLCLLHDKALRFAASGAALGKHARHYYDVYQLLGDRAVVLNLKADCETVAKYAAEAHEDTLRFRRETNPRPDRGFGLSPAFCDAAFTTHAAAEYAREMGALGYGVVPPFTDVISRVRELVTVL